MVTTTREQMVDLIFSLPDEQLEQLRGWINENVELQENSKSIMNTVIDNAYKNRKLEEMEEILLGVSDSYEGFIKAVLNYVEKNNKRFETVSEYLVENPEALSADILEFISDQDDFYDEMWEQYVKVGNLKELHEKLRNVPDSYQAFVSGIIRYAATDRTRKEKVLAYMNETPNARISDITKFVMEQDDFHETSKFLEDVSGNKE